METSGGAFLVLKLVVIAVNPGFHLPGGQFVYDFRKPVIRKAVHRDVNSLLCFPNFGNIKLFEIFPW
jgi:hypothetical protein